MQKQGPFQDVLQLPDISWPRVPAQALPGGRVRRRRRKIVLASLPLEDRAHERLQVPHAVAEGRHVHPDDVQAVVEVLAEAAGRDLAGAGRGSWRRRSGRPRDGARLRPRGGSRAPAVPGAASPAAGRDLADLVQEERAAVGHLEEPARGPHRPGERRRVSCPKSSLSSSVSASAAQFTRTNGRARARRKVVDLAGESSLPVPVSPVRSTVARVGATRRISSRTASMRASRATSREAAAAAGSSARVSSSMSSGRNGFSRKRSAPPPSTSRRRSSPASPRTSPRCRGRLFPAARRPRRPRPRPVRACAGR